MLNRRLWLTVPAMMIAVGMILFSLPGTGVDSRDSAVRAAGPRVPPPERPDWDPSRQQEGGPDQKRAYEVLRLADPATGVIPPDIHRREQAFASRLPAWSRGAMQEIPGLPLASAKIPGWTYRGPHNIGGRTRALAIDVSDPTYRTLLAGGISGGMWRSVNDGTSWTLTTGSSQLHSVTSVAQDTRPGHQDVWYYATGEARGNSASGGGAAFRGDGVFKSVDAGVSWSLLPSTSGADITVFSAFWQYVWRVAIDPSNAVEDEVYAANWGHINRSTDGGATFTPVLGDANTLSRYTEVVVSPSGVVYASLSSDGGQSGIFRSVDGITWAEITPPGLTGNSRIVMGLAPTDENIMYALVDGVNGTSAVGFYKYFYLSGDGSGTGGFWFDRSAQMAAVPGPSGNQPMSTQGSYDMVVTVNPVDPEIVYIGGVHLIRSTDGFATANNDTWIGGWQYANHHADQHWLLFQPGSFAVAYSGSDGGVHKTLDVNAGQVAWSPLNNGYNTSQFYTAAIDENLPGSTVVIGGMQDNGTWHTSQVSSTASWKELLGGDGSFCGVIDASGATGSYQLSVQNGVMYRYSANNSSGNWVDWTRVDPTGGGNYLFINPFILDPNNTTTVFLGTSNGIWRNNDISAVPLFSNSTTSLNWDHVTTQPAGAYVSALAMSRSAGRILYFGTFDGRMYRIDNAHTAGVGTVPAQLNMGPSFPANSYVSGITVHPDDDQKVLLAVSNYNVNSIFYTEDGGATWTVPEGNLGGSDGPSVRTMAIVPYGGLDVYFAATSTGLYSTYTLAGGATVWQQEAPTLIGNVVVDHLATRPADGVVVAATHGKGVYSINLPAGTPVGDNAPARPAALAQNVPNPFNPMTRIGFTLPAAATTSLVVYDLAGRRVRTLVDGPQPAGEQSVSWNGADEGGRQVSAGVYLYRLQSGELDEVKTMTLVR